MHSFSLQWENENIKKASKYLSLLFTKKKIFASLLFLRYVLSIPRYLLYDSPYYL